ncbi:hypothetical protein HELRODRAFT_189860 [Helobdella robusta]|uniref:PPM-type phosphatase domain-containing protein n=1 Tax=Helobdella robusta TaxID=6412 RepID=T1FRF4_HELRO|nr:hypothetical protein HELRODRAFT_189860 [Helobdella robusta]ESN90438.1 hypothetical protein HELRODRAFT_189860 [Helobdella robusta]
MTDVPAMLKLFWSRYVNFETLIAVFVLVLVYQLVLRNEALHDFVGRLLIKLELRLTGNYDHVPVDGESIVSGYKTKASWEFTKDNVSVFAVQGRRPHMEDRFNVVSPLDDTGTSIFGIFDGHGGDFAADFVEKTLFKSIMVRLLKTSLKRQLSQNVESDLETEQQQHKSNEFNNNHNHEKLEYVKIENMKKDADSNEQVIKNIEKSVDILHENSGKTDERHEHKALPHKIYQSVNKKLRKIIRDEILNVDKQLLEIEKSTGEISGSTLLLAMLHKNTLIVANVGDSRGVLCDQNDKVIPLSFDHKPHLAAERKRIKKAGGFVSFNGVWRVAGILALSRAMGDYPLKEKNFVVADPDILTFNLKKIKPKFMILASDGLWDVFSNEEAVQFISSRLHEPHLGAKSLVLQAYYRGSLDNISIMVVKFSYGDHVMKEDGDGVGVGSENEEDEDDDDEAVQNRTTDKLSDDDDDDVMTENCGNGDNKLNEPSSRADNNEHHAERGSVSFHLPTANDANVYDDQEHVDKVRTAPSSHSPPAEHLDNQDVVDVAKDDGSFVKTLKATVDTDDDDKINHWKIDATHVGSRVSDGAIRLMKDDSRRLNVDGGIEIEKNNAISGNGDEFSIASSESHDRQQQLQQQQPHHRDGHGEDKVSKLVFVSGEDDNRRKRLQHMAENL